MVDAVSGASQQAWGRPKAVWRHRATLDRVPSLTHPQVGRVPDRSRSSLNRDHTYLLRVTRCGCGCGCLPHMRLSAPEPFSDAASGTANTTPYGLPTVRAFLFFLRNVADRLHTKDGLAAQLIYRPHSAMLKA